MFLDRKFNEVLPEAAYDSCRIPPEIYNIAVEVKSMKIKLLALFLLLAFSGAAQDLTGIWRGYFNQVNYQRDADGSRYKFEVQVDHNLKSNYFSGVTYSYLTTVFYGKATCSGTLNVKNGKIFLEELKLVEVKMAGPSDACIMTFFLQYSKSGDEEFLEGTYTSMNMRDSTNCGRGTVFLRRVVTSDFYKEPFLVKKEKEREKERELAKTSPKKEEPPVVKTPPAGPKPPVKSAPLAKKPVPAPPRQTTANKPSPKTNPPIAEKDPKPSNSIPRDTRTVKADTINKAAKKPLPPVTPKVLANRQNEVVKTIITSANEVELRIYDNGTIDNDTVSVYLDKVLVVSKARLTSKPIIVKFKLDDTNDFHELVMVAENLGEIPPNTSLMIVNAASKQYEVRITSTEQKNAMVIFKYEKD